MVFRPLRIAPTVCVAGVVGVTFSALPTSQPVSCKQPRFRLKRFVTWAIARKVPTRTAWNRLVKPPRIPSTPHLVYADKGWTDWRDFLGLRRWVDRKAGDARWRSLKSLHLGASSRASFDGISGKSDVGKAYHRTFQRIRRLSQRQRLGWPHAFLSLVSCRPNLAPMQRLAPTRWKWVSGRKAIGSSCDQQDCCRRTCLPSQTRRIATRVGPLGGSFLAMEGLLIISRFMPRMRTRALGRDLKGIMSAQEWRALGRAGVPPKIADAAAHHLSRQRVGKLANLFRN